MSRPQYEASGVNVEAGDQLVDWLQSEELHPELSELRKNLVSGIGGFASLFRASFTEYKKPCLITCTDGVGTKVLVAAHFRDFSGIGQDLVAMCVNDLICSGGDPLLFLDYYAVGKLDLHSAKEFLSSVKRACLASRCLLVGGETAEMPGVYKPGHFDCAGFAVGVVDEDQTWGAHKVQEGDQVLGVSSSGFHSNGYSLLRRVFEKDIDQWKDELLKPTALYVELVQKIRSLNVEVHAAAHMTGGGIENIPRVLPQGLYWEKKDWPWPDSFLEVQRRTEMSHEEMLHTLNCGVGFSLILPADSVFRVQTVAAELGFLVHDLGRVRSA